MNPLEKLNRERSPTSDNVSYMVDNKKCMCPHGKLHTSTAGEKK